MVLYDFSDVGLTLLYSTQSSELERLSVFSLQRSKVSIAVRFGVAKHALATRPAASPTHTWNAFLQCCPR